MKLTKKQLERASQANVRLRAAAAQLRQANNELKAVYRDTIQGSNVERERQLLPLIYGASQTVGAQADVIGSLAFVHSEIVGIKTL